MKWMQATLAPAEGLERGWSSRLASGHLPAVATRELWSHLVSVQMSLTAWPSYQPLHSKSAFYEGPAPGPVP